jgi:hypothetical protein
MLFLLTEFNYIIIKLHTKGENKIKREFSVLARATLFPLFILLLLWNVLMTPILDSLKLFFTKISENEK